MKKHPLKSKTVNSALVVVIMVCMSLLGIGEEQIGQTYDTISDATGQKTESALDIAKLVGLGGVIYGRFQVKEKEDE